MSCCTFPEGSGRLGSFLREGPGQALLDGSMTAITHSTHQMESRMEERVLGLGRLLSGRPASTIRC